MKGVYCSIFGEAIFGEASRTKSGKTDLLTCLLADLLQHPRQGKPQR